MCKASPPAVRHRVKGNASCLLRKPTHSVVGKSRFLVENQFAVKSLTYHSKSLGCCGNLGKFHSLIPNFISCSLRWYQWCLSQIHNIFPIIAVIFFKFKFGNLDQVTHRAFDSVGWPLVIDVWHTLSHMISRYWELLRLRFSLPGSPLGGVENDLRLDQPESQLWGSLREITGMLQRGSPVALTDLREL